MANYTGRLFEAGSVFNVPFGSQAQWTNNTQLSGGGFYLSVNTVDGTGYNDTIYQASDSDPLVTVSGTQNWQGNPNAPFQVHIPADAAAAVGGDSQMNVVDNGVLYSIGNFQMTGSNTATGTYTAIESATGDGVTDKPTGQFDGSDYDFAVGQITGTDLSQADQTGVIDHMVRIAIPEQLAHSYSSTSTNVLAPNAGPQTMEDGYALSGNGGGVYTGTLNYGLTVGIPAGVAEPADIKANQGANILWNTLQQHGAMIRDTNGSGNTNITLYGSQDVSQNNPDIQGMDQYGGEIATYLRVLNNQSPTLVNGNPGSNWVANGSSGGSTGGTGGSTGGTGGTASPNETVINEGVGSINDGTGDVYTITSAGQLEDNGAAINGGAGTLEAEWYNGTLYAADSANWFTYSGGPAGQFTQVASAPPGSGGTGSGSDASPSGTVITPGSGTITDNAGNLYSIDANGNAIENGTAMAGGAGTAQMEFYNGTIYGESTGGWYTWSNSTDLWTAASAPPSTGGGGSTGGGTGQTTVTVPAGTYSFTENSSNVLLTGTGNHLLYLGGSNDTVDLTGGTIRVSQTAGGNNTFDVQAAGNGMLEAGNGLFGGANPDKLDLTAVLKAAGWDNNQSDIGSYLQTTETSSGATQLQVAAAHAPGGVAATVATIFGANDSLATVLSHSIT